MFRPGSIHVKLYANGEIVYIATLSEENGWFVTVEVPVFGEDYIDIVYSWKEAEVPGYHEESEYIQGTVTTIVNRPYDDPIIPAGGPKPKLPGKIVDIINIDEYETALGAEFTVNHCGDCFD